MSITVTCPTCGQPHAVVPGIGKAHPGEEYGGRWLSAGPSASLTLTGGHGATVVTYTWPCVCGALLAHQEPALETVPCVHKHRGGCTAYVRRATPPSDVHTNPRHGAACPCCGQQGVHLVRVDRAGELPACLRTAAASTCVHGAPEGDCPSCAACAACDGSCGTCPYAGGPLDRSPGEL